VFSENRKKRILITKPILVVRWDKTFHKTQICEFGGPETLAVGIGSEAWY